jgi:hypothetical protein
MKSHRPWQPHMSNNPLFNPYTPAGHPTTLNHFDLVEDEELEEEGETPDELSADQASDPPPVMKRD